MASVGSAHSGGSHDSEEAVSGYTADKVSRGLNV